jgi:membrane protein involved in D-alanine export
VSLEPFGNFTYFGLLLIYVAIPAIILGLFGRANARWALFVTVVLGALQFQNTHEIWKGFAVKEVWIALAFLVWQWLIAVTFLRFKFRGAFPLVLFLSSLPVILAKYVPPFAPHTEIAFLGISYVTFRALDVVFSIRDRVVTSVPLFTYIGFLFFVPTISEGPIDRFRRFTQDWQRSRTRDEFLNDLDLAVQRLFRGFLYKFIIANLIYRHFVDPWSVGGAAHMVGYMYAYTFYLFFDFAGYSAFAISFSYLLGVRTVENFNQPFLAPNIRDFWTRWHISLSFWFRDHIYMRFLLAAAKGKWFKNKHTTSYVGLFLTFGLMGIWHGPQWYYWLYGVYHAALLCGYDWFSRWNKTRNWFSGGRAWDVANIVITFHFIAFGLLLFSGRLVAKPLPEREEVVEKLTCQEISGYIWNRATSNTPATLDISMDGHVIGRVVANELRDDLVERGMGTGKYGFHLALPVAARDGHEHWVVPVVVATPPRMISGPDIPDQPYIVHCPTPEAEGATSPSTPSPATPVPAPH